ncbi:DNA-processing protein DprA [Micromonospora sp. 4G57]|uniref:DNA-processing protein DprA n=1 Tax=Micromonospora sicca TaxID=2202420 RepID=A0ABU5JDM0_9ACTN|nr:MULTISPECIES: DNA-processing protein DprA [unclassified Micromonospora]MDZ5442555.1 DNA-processing protein DprA [Micromonospora sp. 4G57]MDZ5490693.1 DNA-processing protein DprA [Micromonospora sp. 4G53]
MSGDEESNTADRLARVALTWLTEPGTWSVHRLVERLGAPAALALLCDGGAPEEKLHATVAARLAAGDPRAAAARALERTDRLGARIVTPDDDEWPVGVDELRRLALSGASRRVDTETAPPLCFWVRGAWPLAEAMARSVAVVGARAATSYGVHVATELGYGLADREWSVVSGGAFGIDAAAHRGALSAGGLTVAVLACGVDRPYPMGNAALFDRIAETGLLVSEWMPGAEPLRPRFLIRNRVIAAATRGSVLVEASARSGATQTMRRALAIDRPGMVVPGPVTSAMSVGAHELLREQPAARLVTGVAHVLEEVGRIGADLAPPARGPRRPADELDDEAALVLESLPRRGLRSPDAVAAGAGVGVRVALRKLSLLEELGLVVRRDGGYALAPPPERRAAGARPAGAPPPPE